MDYGVLKQNGILTI